MSRSRPARLQPSFRMSRSFLRGALVAGLLALASLSANPAQAQDGALIFLVRHAEKVDDSRDPELSAAGLHRAELLAAMLAEAGIDRIVSTDFIRTRDTARPLADALGLEVGSYDPRDLAEAATQLKEWGGRILVSGHSNTTPSLVEALGGDPGSPIDDAEYDRLYLVAISPDGRVATTLIRYGEFFMSER